MHDFSKNISKFHDDKVRLTNDQRADMKRRRDTNLQRIGAGLNELNKPEFVEVINQGGYAQRTMTQPPEKDQESRYDIDLGVVFEDEAAAGPRTTRNWVKDAITLKATSIKNDPETKQKCVRVVYGDGYQCDFPVFRRRANGTSWTYELSSGEDWIASDPSSMNKWIDSQVSIQSHEAKGSYQLRRIIRLGKFYSKTHSSRYNRKFPGGLVATALFIEAYVSVVARDDEAFRETLRVISTRSKHAPVFANGQQISDEKDVDRIGRLIDEALKSVEELDKLNAQDITDVDAKKAWKKVFHHSFFDATTKGVIESFAVAPEKKSVFGTSLAAPFLASEAVAKLSDTEKVDRMEAAVSARRESGEASKPWSK